MVWIPQTVLFAAATTATLLSNLSQLLSLRESCILKVTFKIKPLCQNSCLFFFRNKLQNIVHAALHHAANLLDTFDRNILIAL